MSKNIIVAVSGGPDSMALLDILKNAGHNCIVAHVNYGLRQSALRDQKIIENYCNKYNFEFELLNIDNVSSGNFQAFARSVRYNFFIELSKKYNVYDVYVAHHQDDVLETYIMQKKRKITPRYYGIKENLEFKSINIIRPLLDYSKEDLIKYCLINKIEYGIDETNLEEDYKRNKIRHQIVDKMSKKDKALMIKEIETKNIELNLMKKKTEKLYAQFSLDNLKEFIISLDINEAVDVMRLWFEKNHIYNISKDEYFNILKFIKADNNPEYSINKDYSLFKDYKKLTLVYNQNIEYSYSFDEIEFNDFKHFKIKGTGSRFEAVTVRESDFPIVIRNFNEGDKIKMRYGNKRVSRWFIDNKVDPSLRRSWPIVVNSSNEVILVPGIGCNLTHFSNNPNMFVVK